MSRYFTGQLRCTDDCLFGRTEEECHRMIESIHPTLSRDVYGHGTDGIISVKEMDGSCGPVVERLIRTSVCIRTPSLNLKRMLWCSIFFDENVSHYRPIFFTKEGVAELLQ